MIKLLCWLRPTFTVGLWKPLLLSCCRRDIWALPYWNLDIFLYARYLCSCMQDTFARATHSAYAAGRPSAARDDRVSCIQPLLARAFGLKVERARATIGYLVYKIFSQTTPVRERPKFQKHPLPVCRTSFENGPKRSALTVDAIICGFKQDFLTDDVAGELARGIYTIKT